MDRNWISQIKLAWSGVHRVIPETVNDVCTRHASVFKPDLMKLMVIEQIYMLLQKICQSSISQEMILYAFREDQSRKN